MITQIPYNNRVKQKTITPLLALSGLHSPISLLYFLLFIGPNSLLIRAEFQGTEGTPFSQTLCFPVLGTWILACQLANSMFLHLIPAPADHENRQSFERQPS
jgi:hypothetical protein